MVVITLLLDAFFLAFMGLLCLALARVSVCAGDQRGLRGVGFWCAAIAGLNLAVAILCLFR